MIELLFAFIVVAAVIAVLFKPKTGGMLVMILAMGAAFWQLAEIVGPEPWLAIFAVFVAAALKIIDELTGGNAFGNVSLAVAADRVLTRLQGGGGQVGPVEGQEQRRPPRIWTDQDDDDDD